MINTNELPEERLERHRREYVKSFNMPDLLGEIAWNEYVGSGQYSEDIRLRRWAKSDLIYKSVLLAIKGG